MREALRSKIHKAKVTEANLNYVGSITIDKTLVEKASLWEGEKVLVVDNANGARIETYVIPGETDSGKICMNGAASWKIKKGDEIIIVGFELTDKPLEKSEIKNILVDENNKFERYL